ncbi:MAG: leucine-rich repeat domain-containing protein [Bacteroidales bacterium]|nr:leucine-rich repeat domain-containing protein [Bacteroidales bacterium]
MKEDKAMRYDYPIALDEKGRAIFPEGVTFIREGEFTLMRAWNGILLPKSLIHISDEAFRECEWIRSVHIPEGVEFIGRGAFAGCFSIREITVSPKNKHYRSEGNCLLSADGKTLYLGCRNSVIPPTVERIGEEAFRGCRFLEEISIPEGVKEIGDWTFCHCANLKAVHFPSTLRKIGNGAFWGCKRLLSVDLPDGLTTLGAESFGLCTALEKVLVPDKVSYLGEGLFNLCSGIESLEVAPLNPYFRSEGNCILSDDGKTLLEGCSASVVPEGVEKLRAFAFSGRNSLRVITLPEGVKEIGEEAFCRCTNLSRVSLPKSLSVIGSFAFEECSSLEELDIPEGVTLIYVSAFCACTSLTKMNLYPSTPPDTFITEEDGFYAVDVEITVPPGRKDAYESDGFFAYCSSIEERPE